MTEQRIKGSNGLNSQRSDSLLRQDCTLNPDLTEKKEKNLDETRGKEKSRGRLLNVERRGTMQTER